MKHLFLSHRLLPVFAILALIVWSPPAAVGNIMPYGRVNPTSATVGVFKTVTIEFLWCTFTKTNGSHCEPASATWATTGGHLSTTKGTSTTWSDPSHVGGTYTVTASSGGKNYTCKIKAT